MQRWLNGGGAKPADGGIGCCACKPTFQSMSKRHGKGKEQLRMQARKPDAKLLRFPLIPVQGDLCKETACIRASL